MKFLLVAINAKYIHSNLAVYSLKAYAEKYGMNENEIEIAEYTINQYVDEILSDIYEKKPDAIGFSCYIWNIKMIREIIENYKKISPETDIWVGGPEVSYNAQQVLKDNIGIDYVICGEGEETFKNIVDNYENDGINVNNLKEIKGIVFKKEGEIISNKLQEPLDLSNIPFAYKDMRKFENKIVYYETSRGCPFSCSYCLSSIDKKLRFRDINIVKEELKIFIDNKVAQVKFVDRTFNCNHDHAMEIWKFIKENDNGITNFHFEIAADLIKEDEIELIGTMRPGLIQLEIGVQSTNEETITSINRKTDFSKIKKVTETIKKAGNIHQHLDLIAGLPYEDYNSFANSFNQVYALKPDQLQLGFLKVLHGSKMEKFSRDGDIVYSGIPPYEVLSTKWINYSDLLKLKAVETVLEIYYNSTQFVNTIECLEKEFETAFELYEKLGEFYKNNSPNGAKHSRVDRYNLLLQFAEKLKKSDSVNYRETLTMDFYLRENAKKRPEFSLDISYDRKAIRRFFKSDDARKVLPDYAEYDSKQIEKMTHVEVFGIDIKEKSYILFDYKNKNPLTRQARIVDITDLIKE